MKKTIYLNRQLLKEIHEVKASLGVSLLDFIYLALKYVLTRKEDFIKEVSKRERA